MACLVALAVAGCGQDSPMSDASVDGGDACTDAQTCNDGVYCNGPEQCTDGRCAAGTPPCEAALCSEATDSCETDCDSDGDGHDAVECGGSDCDDDDAARFPFNWEVCDANDLDEDCDPTTFGALDADGDGFASDACCNVATDSTRHCGEDCDDARRGANPNVPDVCDAVDNDCDTAIDEGALIRCYLDTDGDGYALADAASIESCVCAVRTTPRPPSDADDCNDALPDVSPGSPEICANSRDDDCDDTVDEAGSDWYRDCDGDGYGTGVAIRACVSPGTPGGCPGGGHVLISGDCNDMGASVYPGAPEICDGVFNDCGTPTVDGAAATSWCNSPGGPAREPNTLHTCSGGSCLLDRCVTGFLDCSGSPGCETEGSGNAANCGVCGNQCIAWGGAGACVTGQCGTPLAIIAGGQHSCALRGSGRVDCWGVNNDGQVGDATSETPRLAPTPVVGLTDAVQLTASGGHTCARRATGVVVCWGVNANGQIGDGTTTDRITPTLVPGLTNVVDVAAGPEHTCAVQASGAVACWGRNTYGEIGDGTTGVDRRTPTLVPGLTDAVEVSAGGDHTCARRRSGALLCWGRNADGQLGNGTTAQSSVPTAVSGLTDAVQLTAGREHTCALRASGQLMCWGHGTFGRLGDGTDLTRRVPTPVSGLTDVVQVSAGDSHTCAVRTSGAAVCWGAGGGALGDGTMASRSTPTPVSGLTDAAEISAGGDHTCARRISGAVECWGANYSGQLGDGTTTPRYVPTAVPPP